MYIVTFKEANMVTATPTTAMDLSGIPALDQLPNDITLGVLILDASQSVHLTGVTHLVVAGQVEGLGQMQSFPKNQGHFLATYLFSERWWELHPFRHVNDAEELSSKNYDPQRNSATLLYKTVIDVIDRVEPVAELLRQGGKSVTTVYGLFTDSDGDNQSADHGVTVTTVGDRVESLRQGERPTSKFFYCGMGGADSDYHRDIAEAMAIPPDMTYIIDRDTKMSEFGREIRHAFGMFSQITNEG